MLLARGHETLRAVVSAIEAKGGKATAYSVDLSNWAAVAATAQRILSEIGVPDVVVNNAGAGRWQFVEETSAEDAVQMMALPYFAAFYVTKAFLPQMLARRSGTIVTVNSPVAHVVWPGATGYAAARWALRGFTEALRADLRGTGVHVMAVCAGKTASDYFTNNPGAEERIPKFARLLPTLTPEDVAVAMVRGLERQSREVIIPFGLRLTLLCQRFFPRLMAWLSAVTGVSH